MFQVSISYTDQGVYRDPGDNVIGNTLILRITHGNNSDLFRYDYYSSVMETGHGMHTYFKLLYNAWPLERHNGTWIMDASFGQYATR